MIGVTGASGFIGSHLLAQLGDSGFSINLRALDAPDVLADCLRDNDCRTIVHLAGPLPGDSNADVVATELAQRIAGAAMSLDECHIIFSSTIRVHSREQGVFGIDSEVAPFDAYGLGKAKAESVFLGCADDSHPLSILRVSSVQGVGINGRAQGLLSVFARQAAMGGPITVMGDGTSIKDLVGIDTVLDAIGDCVLYPPNTAPYSQIIPVGSGRATTVGELAEVVSNVTGVGITHIEADTNDLSGYVDCETDGGDLQGMVENVWRAVKSEMGGA
jgi:nucleoside-diphosphate-sugar epimerase